MGRTLRSFSGGGGGRNRQSYCSGACASASTEAFCYESALVNSCVHVSNVKSFQELHFFQISGSQAKEEH